MPYEIYEPPKRRKRKIFRIDNEELQKAIEEYKEKGGQVTKLSYPPGFYEQLGRYESASQPNLSELI